VVDAVLLVLAAVADVERGDAEVLQERAEVGTRAEPSIGRSASLAAIFAMCAARAPPSSASTCKRARTRCCALTPVSGSRTSADTWFTKCWNAWLPPAWKKPRPLPSVLR
jgi:hypothetical protein